MVVIYAPNPCWNDNRISNSIAMNYTTYVVGVHFVCPNFFSGFLAGIVGRGYAPHGLRTDPRS